MDSPTEMGTPSPGTPLTGGASSSRRPPRKSTLTQQQKNQKRQRATQDQLITLEHEFNKNPTPTALTRERIAEQINMTERSVQIWFQNRYAMTSPTAASHANHNLDEQRLRTLQGRVSRMARIARAFPSRCVDILPCRPWSQARGPSSPVCSARTELVILTARVT